MIPPWCLALCGRLEAAGVRYVVVSGAAVVLHGFDRPIADLDLVIDPAPDSVARAMKVLLQAGFVPSLPLPLSAVVVMRLFDPAEREVDAFVRYAVPFPELWAGSRPAQAGGGQVRVLSLEHLLRVKRGQARPHDLLDVAGLLALGKEAGPEVEVRDAGPQDLPFLERMFVEATSWDPNAPRQTLAALLAVPEIRRYFVDWGQRAGDRALLALAEGRPVAAAWYRFFTASEPGYGFVEEGLPELGIAVAAEWRGRAVGTRLLEELMGAARAAGCSGLSLSVGAANPARRLYERLGFAKVDEAGTSWTMVARWAPGQAGSTTHPSRSRTTRLP
jgi:GNAT superfamily N-acetyltransferase